MSQLYVPDKVWLVCSDGMKKSQLKVTSQTTVQIADGRLAATINDRFDGNFVCAKMVIAGAIIGAIAAALFVAFAPAILGAGAVAGATMTIGAGTAMAIGAGGAAGGAVLGGMGAMMPSICSILCFGSQWQPVHPKVLVQSQKALVENSKINCFLGGNVMIFYSEAAAEEFSDLVMQNTFVKVGGIILGSALLSSGVASIMTASSAFFTNITFIKATFGAKAAFMFASEGVTLFGVGVVSSHFADKLKESAYKKLKINDYVKGKVVQDADDLLGTSSLLPKEVRGLKDDFKSTLPNWMQDKFPEDIQGAASVTDHFADGSGILGDMRPNTSQYEIWDHQQESGLYGNNTNITESNPEYNNTRDYSATRELHPQIDTHNPVPIHINDGTHTYVERVNSRYEVGTQLHSTTWREFSKRMGRTISNAVPDADTYRRPETGKKRPFPIELALDVYNGFTNYFLEDDVKKLKDTLDNEEVVAKASITVIENDI